MRRLKELIVALGLIAICDIASAQQPATLRVAFNIPQQPLADALMDWSRQSGLQVLRRDTASAGQEPTAPQVKGELSATEALDRLLANTSLSYEFVNERTVSIRSKPAERSSSAGESRSEEAVLRVAQAEAAARSGDPSGTEAASAAGSDDRTENGIPEILVKGARSLNTDIARSRDAIQPYVIFDRKAIENSGAADIQEFLKQRLTSTTTSVSPGQLPVGSSGNTTSINLRGLGTSQTLILVDGHRVARFAVSGSPAQPDLNGIPLAAIERIEILPATASGIYGGGATGGVVNVVLKRDFHGVDVRTTFEDSFKGGGALRRVDMSAGFDLDGGRTSVLFGGSYSDAGGMIAGDRDFTAAARRLTIANNPASIAPTATPPLGFTTNIRSTGGSLTLKGSNLPLNSLIASVPVGYAGPQSDNGLAFLTTAGRYNLDLADSAQPMGRRQTLMSSPEVRSFTATVNRQFTGRIKSYLTLSDSKNINNAGSLTTTSAISLLGTSPGNPFNQPVQVIVPVLVTGSDRTTTIESRNAVGGVVVDLGKHWQASFDYTWNRTEYSFNYEAGYNNTAAQNAARAGTLNIFADVNRFPVDITQFPLAIPVSTLLEPIDTTMQAAAVRIGGPILRLPAGPVNLSLLGEHRREEFGRSVLGTTPPFSVLPTRSQAADSVYLELTAPLVSPAQAIPFVRRLDLQLAGRRDVYRTLGSSAFDTFDLNDAAPPGTRNSMSSNNPTLGFSWQPLTDATVRMSYGTGFLPPDVTQLVPSQPSPTGVASFTALQLRDPLRGNEFLGTLGDVNLYSGGSPDLRPEESKSSSIGLVLTPRVLQGFRASVDWIHISKTDEIASLGLQQVYINAGDRIPGYITRGPVPANDPFGIGPIVALNSASRNVQATQMKAYDVALEYRFDAQRLGTFVLSSAATRNLSLRRRAVPTADELDSAGLIGALKWRANASIQWDWREWSAVWNTRFYDSYWVNLGHTVNVSQGAATIPSQMYHDLFVTRRFQEPLLTLKGLEARVGVKNLFGKSPPIDVSNSFSGLYYSALGDPRLASYYLSLKAAF